MRVIVSNKNNVGRVTFGKIAKVGSLEFSQIGDVVTTGEQDGDVLVYQANTNTYVVKVLPKVDGGTY